MQFQDVSLSSAARASVFALGAISTQALVMQKHLSTGRKVNAPLDNPVAFFTASSLTGRAAVLGALTDTIDTATSTIAAANNGITGLQSLAQSMKAVAQQALSTADPNARESYAAQYNDLRAQFDQLAGDASYNGVNLLAGNSLTTTFNEDGSSSYTVSGSTVNAASLGLNAAANNFVSDNDINAALGEVSTTLTSLQGLSSQYGTAASVLSVRSDFNTQMTNLLNSGAENLVGADMNETGAAILALQTRQQLATVSLSLAANAESNALRLFASGG